MSTNETFLLALLIIFALPWAVWRLLGGRSTIPLVVVQIVGGVMLGPGALGNVLPEVYGAIFRPEVISMLNGLALWAVTMFVFLAGMELDANEAWVRRRETAITAGLALAVPLALGTLAALFLVQGPGWVGLEGSQWQAVCGIGMASAVTALPILVLFLQELSILRTPFGQRILRYASLDDIAIWGVLALILLDWTRITRQVGFLVLFIALAPLARRLLREAAPRHRWPLALIWLVLVSLGADWAGLHFMVGAFLAGAVIDARWFGVEQVDRLRDAVLLTVMPVFFLSTGLRTSWSLGGSAVFAAAGLLLVASVGGKLIGTHLAGWILGWDRTERWVIGWLLQTKALIMIIFANILLDKAIISAATFTALLLMAVASTLLTLPVVMRLLGLRSMPEGTVTVVDRDVR